MLSFNYYPINPDEGIKYGEQGLKLADKLHWKPGIAQINGHLGINYAVKADYQTAIDHFLSALNGYEELGNKNRSATTLVNIGNIYLLTADYPQALDFYLKALKVQEELDNKRGIALSLANIGLIYKNQSDMPKALSYFSRALEINEELGLKNNMANNLSSIGIVYDNQENYPKALEYFTKALEIQEALGAKDGIAKSLSYIGSVNVHQEQYELGLQHLNRSLELAKELGNELVRADNLSLIGAIYLAAAKDITGNSLGRLGFNGNRRAALLQARKSLDEAITIQRQTSNLKGLAVSYESLSEVAAMMGDYENGYHTQRLFKMVSDSIFNLEKDKKITQAAMQYEFDKKEAATKAEQEKRNAIAREKMNRQKLVLYSFISGFALVLAFMWVFYRQRNRIKSEKKKSDDLLLNILPGKVAEELKVTGSAEAQMYEQVSVLFTDFKGFTQISARLGPKELVGMINECYSAFDRILEKYGVEKIKTIGDSYMAAGGLPVPNHSHAADTVSAALAIRQFMSDYNKKKSEEGMPIFEIRIGIHTGPVIAGIVGLKKFAYDIWGDTVNLASRMEASCKPGNVNISRSTYELTKDAFSFTYRGKITTKDNEDVDMYFVENLIP
ncbi:MAG TPA: adenylate/guanylate cyclase domain-containing protein [Flavilitoribacter sp.]|nr:adenylate/guanylate cyclase domain-containing protein [Flavilitoribacter sp.]HMQ90448.1 adenylate/guanylate cyclase domain-containing protein [Flavilitoribacter sp.]